MPDDARRAMRRPVAANGKAIFILVHVGVGTDGYLQMFGQQAGRRRQDGFGVGGIDHAVADGVQHCQATGQEYRGGCFGHRVEQTDHHALGIANRAVAKGEIGLFRRFVALDQQREVFDIGGVPIERGVGDRADIVPHLVPDLVERAAQGVGFATQDRRERVVVEGNQLRPPDDGLGETRREAQRNGCLQHIGPVFKWPQGRIGPIVLTNPLCHFAAALQPIHHGVHTLLATYCLALKSQAD